MSRRITFDVKDEVYEKLRGFMETADSSVSGCVKQFLYSMCDEELELSAVESARLERIEESKKRLAEKEREVKKSRGVPKNPFGTENKVSSGEGDTLKQDLNSQYGKAAQSVEDPKNPKKGGAAVKNTGSPFRK